MAAGLAELSFHRLRFRSRANLLVGAVGVPNGEEVATEFALFDAQEQQLLLCRGVPGRCSAARLVRSPPRGPEEPEEPAPGHGTQQGPRQLRLCPRQRWLATLELRVGAAEVAVWCLEAAGAAVPEANSGSVLCTLLARVGLEGIASARALAWLDAEVPFWIEAGASTAAPSAGGYGPGATRNEAVLAVALESEVAVLHIRTCGSGPCSVETAARVRTGFRATCVAWTKDGTQLLVGGPGQMVCVVWGRARADAPHVRHLLCAGDCSDVQAVHNCAFVCRIDQRAACAQPCTQAAQGLLLPDGRRLPFGAGGGIGDPRNMPGWLVVEVETPQDGPPSEGPQPVPLGTTLLDNLEADTNLQVVPCKRCLVPLRCEPGSSPSGATSRQWRLRCGAELEVKGELLTVSSGHTGGTRVSVGSFDSSRIKVWALAEPHSWGRRPGDWREVADVDLASDRGSGEPPATLRLHGLALVSGSRATQLHALLSDSGFSGFDRAPKKLHHVAQQLPPDPANAEELPPAAGPGSGPGVLGGSGVSKVAARSSSHGSPRVAPERLCASPASDAGGAALAEPSAGGLPTASCFGFLTREVAGVRQELRALRESVDAFRADFSRFAGAVELIATSISHGRVSQSS